MQSISRILLILHPEEAFRDRVSKAGSMRFRCWSRTDWESLREALEEAPPAALVMVDPYMDAPGRKGLNPELRKILHDFPSVTVIAVIPFLADRLRDVKTLEEWGVAEVMDAEEEVSLEAIERRLRAAYGFPIHQLLDRALPSNISGRARSILEKAAEVAAAGGQGRDLARMLNLSERTLLRWCERAHLPPPRRVMAWMRILFASDLLDDEGRTVLSVAHACGYVSDSSLRRAMQDFLGIAPTALREKGAFETASGIFAKELAHIRRSAREQREVEYLRAR
jgi:AraC-like DNA-binding protein